MLDLISRIRRLLRRLPLLFMATVLAPTMGAAVYFGLWASDVYTSESRFVVRAQDRHVASPLGLLLRGAGFSRTPDDSYSVQEYILSRDALKILDGELKLGAAFASREVDRLSRFAGLDPDNSFEALHRFYQRMVKAHTDSVTAITTLTVSAFTPQLAAEANQRLLEESEALVNRLNERGRQNLLRYAKEELLQAEARARSAALALSSYRNRQGVVDPERQATMQLQQLGRLQEELTSSRLQLGQLQAVAPANPQIPALQKRISMLEAEIARDASQVTGARQSLTEKAGDFQRLSLELEFANKQLAAAQANLDNVRSEAQRQQVYLERIAQPSLPDKAQEPRRLRSVLATLMMGLVTWGVLGLLLAGVREHQD